MQYCSLYNIVRNTNQTDLMIIDERNSREQKFQIAENLFFLSCFLYQKGQEFWIHLSCNLPIHHRLTMHVCNEQQMAGFPMEISQYCHQILAKKQEMA